MTGVLIAFPDQKTFTGWANSPEYKEISKDRLAATEGSVLLVRGLAQRLVLGASQGLWRFRRLTATLGDPHAAHHGPDAYA